MTNNTGGQISGNDWREIRYEDLIPLTSLISGPIRQRRDHIKEIFVRVSLLDFPIGKSFTVNKLSKSIKSHTYCTIEDETIIPILELFIKEGIVEHMSEKEYKNVIHSEFPDFNTLTQASWDEFENDLRKNLSDYDPFIQKI